MASKSTEQKERLQLSKIAFLASLSANLLEDLAFQFSLQLFLWRFYLKFKISSLELHPQGTLDDTSSLTTVRASEKKQT